MNNNGKKIDFQKFQKKKIIYSNQMFIYSNFWVIKINNFKTGGN